ncbi:MAG TPA: hypothetical protein DC047_20545, partial [Blastocatellia bacterium]|nr:hypothetical protein [Blastocatellia bacterium]
GAKCKSLGHRPRGNAVKRNSAEGAKFLGGEESPVGNSSWFTAPYVAPSALSSGVCYPWGDAPGFCISRPWRLAEPYDQNPHTATASDFIEPFRSLE